MRLIFNYRSLAYLVVFLLAIGCTDEVEEGTQPDTAEFTIEANPQNLLEISFTNLSEKATHYVWNFGDGSPLVYTENPTHVYESPGTYNVTLNARSRGGNKIKIMPLTVEGNEPPNLIQGGDMSDQSLWTVVSAGSTLTDHEFSNEAVTFSNGSASAQTNIIFYTTVDVLAGRNYKFSAKVSGSGATNSWMQVYFGTTAPADGVDYNEGMYTGLNTWDGCGSSAFNGNLAVLGCQGGASGNGKAGAVTFAESGTIYIVFKVGSWDGNLGTAGIILDDVKLQETEQAQGPNLITGGDMSSADAWEFYGAGSTLTTTEFKDGALTFSNGTESAQTNVLVWTEVEVEAGKTYAVSANVKGSGATNSWFELFFGTTAPVEGSDYADGKYRALSTWGGCATGPFNGDLITVGCDGDGNGIITFETSGTIYVVIKSGSWDGNLGTEGITLDDLKLAELL